MRGGRGVLMFFMPLCGCLSENVSVCECVCDCERESERERDEDLNKRVFVCVCVLPRGNAFSTKYFAIMASK